MNIIKKSLGMVALATACQFSQAATTPQLFVTNRASDSYLGKVLAVYNFGNRHDAKNVKFKGSEEISLTKDFSIEAVIHSTVHGKFVWKTSKRTIAPIDMVEENPILTQGKNWGLTIKENKFTLYIQTSEGQEFIEADVPSNWQDPVRAHRLTATVSSSDKMLKIYLDRKLIAMKNFTGQLTPKPKQSVFAGSRADNKAVANKIQINDVRLYAKCLSDKEISNPLTRKEAAVIISADLINTHTLKGAK